VCITYPALNECVSHILLSMSVCLAYPALIECVYHIHDTSFSCATKSVLTLLYVSCQGPSWLGRRELALERVLGRLLERLDRAPHSDLRQLHSMGEDVVYCLNKVPVVEGNTRPVVDIRAVEGHLSLNRATTRGVVGIRAVEAHLHNILVGHLMLNCVITRAVVDTRAVESHLHNILVVDHLSINRRSTRDVVVHAPEGECLSHTTAGVGEVVLDQVFLQVHRDQFPSCTKPHMSNINPLWWYHHPHRQLALPRSLRRLW